MASSSLPIQPVSSAPTLLIFQTKYDYYALTKT